MGDTYLKQHDAPEDIEYYLYGPPMMAKTVLDLLHSLGVDDADIRFDNLDKKREVYRTPYLRRLTAKVSGQIKKAVNEVNTLLKRKNREEKFVPQLYVTRRCARKKI